MAAAIAAASAAFCGLALGDHQQAAIDNQADHAEQHRKEERKHHQDFPRRTPARVQEGAPRSHGMPLMHDSHGGSLRRG